MCGNALLLLEISVSLPEKLQTFKMLTTGKDPPSHISPQSWTHGVPSSFSLSFLFPSPSLASPFVIS